MLRSSFNVRQRFSCLIYKQVSSKQCPVAWKPSKLWPCVSRVNISVLSPIQGTDSLGTAPFIRSLHCATRSPVSSSDFSNNLIPLYNTFPSKILPHRLGLRFMNSDSSNKPPSKEPDKSPPSASSSSDKSNLSKAGPPSAVEEAIKRARDNPSIRGLRDSVDTTFQGVRSKVNPRDLLYYFALLTVFGLLIVGPFAARQMRKSDTDYDELDSEDPINDLAVFVRTEVLQEAMDKKGVGEAGSKMGGLDTLIADLLRSPHIQNAIDELVNKILTSPQFKRSCSILLKELWKDLVEDPETLKQVIHLLYNAIQDEAIKDAAVQLVTEVFADKEVLDEVVELFQRLGQEHKVQSATQELLVESAHNALNDPEILDHSMEFATDVVGDDVVQQTAGEALYNTLSYAVRPTLSVFLAILGTGLIFMSLLAFQHCISPESQSESLDRALTAFEKPGMVQGLISMFTFPWNALLAGRDALVWLLMLPVRLVSRTLMGLQKAGNATVETLNRCIRWLLNLPIQLAQNLVSVIGNGLTAMSDGFARQSRQLSEALSGSYFGLVLQYVADGFVATTRGLKQAWIISNRSAGNSAVVVEELFHRAVQVLEKGVTTTVAGWMVTQSAFISTSTAIRSGWISTNRIMAVAALNLEFYIKIASSHFMASVHSIRSQATKAGLTRKAMRDVSRQTKGFAISTYRSLDEGALGLGLFLEDTFRKLANKAMQLIRRNRPAL